MDESIKKSHRHLARLTLSIKFRTVTAPPRPIQNAFRDYLSTNFSVDFHHYYFISSDEKA